MKKKPSWIAWSPFRQRTPPDHQASRRFRNWFPEAVSIGRWSRPCASCPPPPVPVAWRRSCSTTTPTSRNAKRSFTAAARWATALSLSLSSSSLFREASNEWVSHFFSRETITDLKPKRRVWTRVELHPKLRRLSPLQKVPQKVLQLLRKVNSSRGFELFRGNHESSFPAAGLGAAAGGAVKSGPALIPGGKEAWQVRDARCLEPKQPGNCKGMVHKFYFDADENKCLAFVFTGCGVSWSELEGTILAKWTWCADVGRCRETTINSKAKRSAPMFVKGHRDEWPVGLLRPPLKVTTYADYWDFTRFSECFLNEQSDLDAR